MSAILLTWRLASSTRRITSGARVLLIGRQALIALGLPVLTADYDVWIAFEDIERAGR